MARKKAKQETPEAPVSTPAEATQTEDKTLTSTNGHRGESAEEATIKKSSSSSKGKPLTGKALLKKIEKAAGSSKRDLAIQCGYFTITKTGRTRVDLTSFYNAVLSAQGLTLNSSDEQSQRGREATFRASVHKNGQLIIGSAYTEKAKLKPGDILEIKLGYKHIKLERVAANDAADA